MTGRGFFYVVVLGLLASAGCGVADQPDTGEVHGRVTLGKTPLPGATVTFQPTQGRPSTGMTGPDGSYRLEYNAETPGAKVGDHKVYITTFVAPQINDDTKKVIKAGLPERVPKRYHEQTTLTAKVESGDNEINFDLEPR